MYFLTPTRSSVPIGQKTPRITRDDLCRSDALVVVGYHVISSNVGNRNGGIFLCDVCVSLSPRPSLALLKICQPSSLFSAAKSRFHRAKTRAQNGCGAPT